MEFDELLITTGVDALVRLIREKGRIELDDTSSLLNIPKETLQEWAHVLEEEGIIRLEYKLTKIQLVWVKPTEEEVASEIESFHEEKGGLEKEVEGFRGKVLEQNREIGDLSRSFSEFYEKAYPRIEKLERSVSSSAPAPVRVEGAAFSPAIGREDVLSGYASKLDRFGSEVETLHNSLAGIKSEIESIGIEKKAKDAQDHIAKISSIREELDALGKEVADVKKKSSGTSAASSSEVSMPSAGEFKKKFESIKKEIMSVRAKGAALREDMISLQESSEILKGVAESIMGSEDKVQSLHAEVEELSSQTDSLMKKAGALSAKVNESADLTGRLSTTITTAKGVLTRFPSQEKVMGELERLRSAEDSLLEKSNAIESLLGATGGRQMSAKQFSDISKKIDSKVQDMKSEMDALENNLEEEKATYLAFQKIKERIVPSIESYQKQLNDMESEISKIQVDALKQKESLRQDTEKIQQMLKEPGTQEAMKVVGEIGEKKRQLDEIKSSLDELSETSDNLTKRITLLSQQARLLEIRTGPGAGTTAPENETKKAEIRHQLELSEAEELEFRRKREELKGLIKKLWES